MSNEELSKKYLITKVFWKLTLTKNYQKLALSKKHSKNVRVKENFPKIGNGKNEKNFTKWKNFLKFTQIWRQTKTNCQKLVLLKKLPKIDTKKYCLAPKKSKNWYQENCKKKCRKMKNFPKIGNKIPKNQKIGIKNYRKLAKNRKKTFKIVTKKL